MDFIKIPLTLFIATAVSAILITTMHNVSQPILEARTKEILDEAFTDIYGDNLSSYEMIDENPTKDAIAVYNVSLNDGTTETAFEMAEVGRNGTIKMLITYDQAANVTNLNYLQITETPGIGDKVETESFIGTIVGQNASSADVDTIAGATISSAAVKLGVENSSILMQGGTY